MKTREQLARIRRFGIIGAIVSIMAAAMFGYIAYEADDAIHKIDQAKLGEMVLK